MKYRITIVLLVLAGFLFLPVGAHAYTLGVADGTAVAAPFAKNLRAKTYRIVMDPAVPLDAYAERINAFRSLGMRPQFTIGGTGTTVRGKTRAEQTRIIRYALAAVRRWRDVYSVSVVNEPDLSGASVCGSTSVFTRAYRALKRAKVPRVLYGEFSPDRPLEWTSAAIQRCARRGIIVADGWAWHCYDFGREYTGIQNAVYIYNRLKRYRRHLHTSKGKTLPMYCTEYGVRTRSGDETRAAASWRNALRIARGSRRWPGLRQIVIWGITETGIGSRWDTSLVAADGRIRPAYWAIMHR